MSALGYKLGIHAKHPTGYRVQLETEAEDGRYVDDEDAMNAFKLRLRTYALIYLQTHLADELENVMRWEEGRTAEDYEIDYVARIIRELHDDTLFEMIKHAYPQIFESMQQLRESIADAASTIPELDRKDFHRRVGVYLANAQFVPETDFKQVDNE